jgi:hypothetical protein
MKRWLGTVLLLVGFGLPGPGQADGVRSPRDSSVIVHGLPRPSGSFDSSRLASPQVSLAKLPCPAPYVLEPRPSPGFGPVWVPSSPCWNGSKIIEVPVHGVW